MVQSRRRSSAGLAIPLILHLIAGGAGVTQGLNLGNLSLGPNAATSSAFGITTRSSTTSRTASITSNAVTTNGGLGNLLQGNAPTTTVQAVPVTTTSAAANNGLLGNLLQGNAPTTTVQAVPVTSTSAAANNGLVGNLLQNNAQTTSVQFVPAATTSAASNNGLLANLLQTNAQTTTGQSLVATTTSVAANSGLLGNLLQNNAQAATTTSLSVTTAPAANNGLLGNLLQNNAQTSTSSTATTAQGNIGLLGNLVQLTPTSGVNINLGSAQVNLLSGATPTNAGLLNNGVLNIGPQPISQMTGYSASETPSVVTSSGPASMSTKDSTTNYAQTTVNAVATDAPGDMNLIGSVVQITPTSGVNVNLGSAQVNLLSGATPTNDGLLNNGVVNIGPQPPSQTTAYLTAGKSPVITSSVLGNEISSSIYSIDTSQTSDVTEATNSPENINIIGSVVQLTPTSGVNVNLGSVQVNLLSGATPTDAGLLNNGIIDFGHQSISQLAASSTTFIGTQVPSATDTTILATTAFTSVISETSSVVDPATSTAENVKTPASLTVDANGLVNTLIAQSTTMISETSTSEDLLTSTTEATQTSASLTVDANGLVSSVIAQLPSTILEPIPTLLLNVSNLLNGSAAATTSSDSKGVSTEPATDTTTMIDNATTASTEDIMSTTLTSDFLASSTESATTTDSNADDTTSSIGYASTDVLTTSEVPVSSTIMSGTASPESLYTSTEVFEITTSNSYSSSPVLDTATLDGAATTTSDAIAITSSLAVTSSATSVNRVDGESTTATSTSTSTSSDTPVQFGGLSTMNGGASQSNAGKVKVAAGVGGAIAGAAVLFGALLVYGRRRRNKKIQEQERADMALNFMTSFGRRMSTFSAYGSRRSSTATKGDVENPGGVFGLRRHSLFGEYGSVRRESLSHFMESRRQSVVMATPPEAGSTDTMTQSTPNARRRRASFAMMGQGDNTVADSKSRRASFAPTLLEEEGITTSGRGRRASLHEHMFLKRYTQQSQSGSGNITSDTSSDMNINGDGANTPNSYSSTPTTGRSRRSSLTPFMADDSSSIRSSRLGVPSARKFQRRASSVPASQ